MSEHKPLTKIGNSDVVKVTDWKEFEVYALDTTAPTGTAFFLVKDGKFVRGTTRDEFFEILDTLPDEEPD